MFEADEHGSHMLKMGEPESGRGLGPLIPA